MRFTLLGLALGAILTGAFTSLQAPQAGAFDIFLWLFLLLVVSGVMLWPSTGRDQRAELEIERLSWADRIEFEKPAAAAGRNAAPLRGMPETSHTAPTG